MNFYYTGLRIGKWLTISAITEGGKITWLKQENFPHNLGQDRALVHPGIPYVDRNTTLKNNKSGGSDAYISSSACGGDESVWY